MVYISGHLTKNATRALAVAFPPVDRKVTYRRASKMPRVQGGNVMLRQTGAMLGLDTADREGWWSGYDWVVRLNPDVIVRDDSFLRTQMTRDDVDAIFANCNKGPNRIKVMTDFTAWRPAKVPAGAFRLPAGHTTDCGGRDAWFKVPKCNAERSATAAFEQVLASGRYALLPNANGSAELSRRRVNGVVDARIHFRTGEGPPFALSSRRPLLERDSRPRVRGPVPRGAHAGTLIRSFVSVTPYLFSDDTLLVVPLVRLCTGSSATLGLYEPHV